MPSSSAYMPLVARGKGSPIANTASCAVAVAGNAGNKAKAEINVCFALLQKR